MSLRLHAPGVTRPGDHDAVVALGYRHPALGERAVVRLAHEPLEAAAAVEMEALGFADEPSRRAVVGHAPRRALGFPAWALIHDPERAKHALAVVRRLEAAARRAKTKPGHAKADVDKIAAELARAVPHFLPTFFEEAGRRFLAAGSQRMGAIFFEKAREAERVHALEVDDAARGAVFLEFALAGAVSTKSIATYAKDLSAQRGDEAAWRQLSQLALSRTLGGLPPWASMVKDLRRLAKAAGKDPKAELRAILEAVIEAPALKRAPSAFWKAMHKDVVALAKRDDAVRGALLRLFPEPNGAGAEFDEGWLALLEECGALGAITGEASAAAGPRSARAEWIARWVKHASRHWEEGHAGPRLFALLRAAAPRLIADGVPLRLDWRLEADLDLLDVALELGVPVADPSPHSYVALATWETLAERPERGRDPVHVAADPRFAPLLLRAVSEAIGRAAHERLVATRAGFQAARAAWLRGQLSTDGALPALEARVDALEARSSPTLFAAVDGAIERLAAIDPAKALAKSLRGGLLDELGWPALEEAAEILGVTAKAPPPVLASSWPHVLVGDGKRRVIVVAPDRVALQHELRLPKGAELCHLAYVGEQLLVVWREGAKTRGYWSGSPTDVLDVELESYAWQPALGGYAAAALGGVSTGGRALRVGDASVPEAHDLFCDGETIWRREWRSGEAQLREVDPATGEAGRRSLPAFFEEGAEDGWTLDVWASDMVALPEGVESPLGSREGRYGFRVQRRTGGEQRRHSGIDGRVATGTPHASAIVTLPDGTQRALWSESLGEAVFFVSDEPTSSGRQWYRAGTPIYLPLPFWHFFGPRDVAGSEALRGVTTEQARALLDDEEGALAGVSHPGLHAGVKALVEHTRRIEARLERLRTQRDGSLASPGGVRIGREDLQAVDGELLRGWSASDLAEEARQVIAWMAGEPSTEPMCGLAFWNLPGRLGSLAFRAVATGSSPETREACLRLLQFWAETPFAATPARLRSMSGPIDAASLPAALHRLEDARWGVTRHGTSVFYVQCDWEGDPYDVFEWASGDYVALPGLTIEEEHRAPDDAWGDAEALTRFLEVARARGPLPWREDAPEAIAEATGLGRAQAALLWAGLPGLDSWGSKFLPDELRSALGLKVREAAKARDAMRSLLPDGGLSSVLDGAIGEDPEALYESETPWAPLVKSWLRAVPKRVTLPPGLDKALDALFDQWTDRAPYVQALLEPEASPLLAAHAWAVDEEGQVVATDNAAVCFCADTLPPLARLARWIFCARPVGDPLRSSLAPMIETLRERLRDPELLLEGLQHHAETKEEAEAFLAALGGAPYRPPGASEALPSSSDTGALVGVANEWGDVLIAYRPAAVNDWDLIAKLASPYLGGLAVPEVRWLLEGGAQAYLDRLASSPAPDGAYEDDPRASVPALVAGVMQKRSLDEDAAALYLATLAWVNPADKLVREHFGWTAKALGAARTQLESKGLVVIAKRARAGRKHFLPGGWEALKAPHAPIETWKLPLFAIDKVQALRHGAHVEAREPPHQMFARAWARIEAGDVPAYEEVP